MPAPSNGNDLTDKRYVTVILRLLLDRHGQLVNGEVVDAEARARERFVGWRGLTRAVRSVLSTKKPEDGIQDQ